MTSQADDPLSQAMGALGRLHSPDGSTAAREELEGALLAAQVERAALLVVAQQAGDLVDAIAEYENAAEVDAQSVEQLDQLAQACVAAEDALVDALNHLHEIQTGKAELSDEQGYLAAPDRFADNDDEEPRQ